MRVNAVTHFGDFLQSVPGLAEFGSDDLAVLERAMTVTNYREGHQFIGEDRRSSEIYLIVTGEVVATHRRSHRRGLDIYERLGPGDLFGLVAMIDHRPEWATYRAVGPVTAASLPYSAFDLLFTASTPIAYRFQHLIALQLGRDLRACARMAAEGFATKKSA